MGRTETQSLTILLPVLLGGLGLLVALLETSSTHGFSPDSMRYVEVAHNIVGGEGYTTTVLRVSSEPEAPWGNFDRKMTWSLQPKSSIRLF